MGVTPEELSQNYARLYHMADAQSWDSIQKHGLLSTSSLLDLFGVKGREGRKLRSAAVRRVFQSFMKNMVVRSYATTSR